MPRSLPGATEPLSILSIRRIAPVAPTPSATQRQDTPVPAPSAISNLPQRHASPRSTLSTRADASQVPAGRSTFSPALPPLVRAGNVAEMPRDTPGTSAALSASQAILDASDGTGAALALTAGQRQTLEACAWQLRDGWCKFQDALVAQAVADLDPAWPASARQVFERSVRQLLQDKTPSELLAQPVFARFLEQPGCLRALLPATMQWLQAHTDILEHADIVRTGSSAMTVGKHGYLAGMAELMAGRFEPIIANKTLLTLLEALHDGDPTLAELAAVTMQRVSAAEWVAWTSRRGWL